MNSNIYFSSLASAVLVFVTVGIAYAEDCEVTVRSVMGQDKKEELLEESVDIEPHLQDVKVQLEKIPHKNYRVLESSTRFVVSGSRGDFMIHGPDNRVHRVEVTPHRASEKKIPVTVDWFGPDGDNIVSTKVYVQNGKSVVLGAETELNSSSAILCIGINCR